MGVSDDDCARRIEETAGLKTGQRRHVRYCKAAEAEAADELFFAPRASEGNVETAFSRPKSDVPLSAKTGRPLCAL
jgi:hypothetical protein